MNFENIKALASLLTGLGFEGPVRRELARQICFKPSQFSIKRSFSKGDGMLTCTVFFDQAGEVYQCRFYEAGLLRAPALSAAHSKQVQELDERMARIQWVEASRVTEEEALAEESALEKIVEELADLESTEEGKRMADLLKLKHWALWSAHPVRGEVQRLRARYELIQRFYLLGDQPISLEEAYRFLLNRSLERQLLTEQKEALKQTSREGSEKGKKGGKPLPQKKVHPNSNTQKKEG